jgi:hypothetical protein
MMTPADATTIFAHQNRQTMKRISLLALSLVATILSGCADKEDLDPALFGTWQVTEVKGLLYLNNVPTFPITDSSPSGTVRFDKDGTGFQNYSFELGGNTNTQTGTFLWTATDNEIIIDRQNEPDMIWNRDVNLTNKQEATFTFQENGTTKWDYTLTMEK